MAGKMLIVATAVIAMAASIPSSAAKTTYIVGDSLGWLVPPGGPIAYEIWASLYTFKVGDILLFNFATGEQDVARVTKEAFDNCNSTSPIWLQTNGPYNFTLESAGSYYFIGTMDRHCALGQKLAINVTSNGRTTSPSPSSPPQAPAPTPPRTAVTYIVGDELGWIVPPGGPIAYETWAYGKSFMVGDTLVFNFASGLQDVARVTKEAFENCNSTSPIFLETTGPFNYTLETPGEYYFIGTMDRHCTLGQKLAINVTSSSSQSPSSSPPKVPTPTAPRAPVTYIIGDELGWIVPPGGPIAYETWAYRKTFLVGDELVFIFENGTQDVARVIKEAYESCNTNTTISISTTSPTNITLTSPGEYFFTSTYPRHCLLGQKLAINVTTTAPGSTSPTASSSAPSPLTGGPMAAPPPESAAPSTVIFGFSSILVALAIALLF